MTDQQRFREPLRVTLTRTISIALLAATIAAPRLGGIRRWPVLVALMLWPAFGGHWLEVLFLNWLRPRLSAKQSIQTVARLLLWFGGGIVLALGARLTAKLLLAHPPVSWLPWFIAGTGFVVVEHIAHAGLRARGRPSFYSGGG